MKTLTNGSLCNVLYRIGVIKSAYIKPREYVILLSCAQDNTPDASVHASFYCVLLTSRGIVETLRWFNIKSLLDCFFEIA